jgi:hypothetical protein
LAFDVEQRNQDMGHMIEVRDEQASMAFVGEPPWHTLGAELPPGADADTMLRAAHLNWRVDLYPAASVVDGQVIQTDHFSLVRDVDKRVFDVVPRNESST